MKKWERISVLIAVTAFIFSCEREELRTEEIKEISNDGMLYNSVEKGQFDQNLIGTSKSQLNSNDCVTIDFAELTGYFHFNYYEDLGVIITSGSYVDFISVLSGSPCDSPNQLNYIPNSTYRLSFTKPIKNLTITAGDYGGDEDEIHVTAYSGQNGDGNIISTNSATLGAGVVGCVSIPLSGEGINSAVVSSIGLAPNSVNLINIDFCFQESTVLMGTCDSGVPNLQLSDGIYMSDLIAELESGGYKNLGQTVRSYNDLLNSWVNNGIITGEQKSLILNCVITEN